MTEVDLAQRTDFGLSSVLNVAPALQRLRLTVLPQRVDFDNVNAKPPLKYLHVSGAWQDSHLIDTIAQFPLLEKLSVSECHVTATLLTNVAVLSPKHLIILSVTPQPHTKFSGISASLLGIYWFLQHPASWTAFASCPA